MVEDGCGGSLWPYLPHAALFQVFNYLNYKDLSKVGEVCQNWYNASRDELLWKQLLYHNFRIHRSVPIVAGNLMCPMIQKNVINLALKLSGFVRENALQTVSIVILTAKRLIAQNMVKPAFRISTTSKSHNKKITQDHS